MQFYLIDCKTPLGKAIDVAIILLNVAVCVIFVVDTYPVPAGVRAWLRSLEILAVAFFIIEYAARLYAAPERWKQARNVYSVIDLIAILPFFALIILRAAGSSAGVGAFQTVRIFRVFRIFRFIRFTADPVFFFGAISVPALKIARLAMTIFMIFFVSAGLFLFVERPANPAVETFGDAFYFTVVTLTTVGFGDIIPVTAAGRWVTVLMVFSGIILIPWQASRVAREWSRMSAKARVVCPGCGLRHHDKDASHCKACGRLIFQEYDGDAT